MTVGNDKPVDRCDRSLEAGVLMDSPLPYHPLGGSEVLHRAGAMETPPAVISPRPGDGQIRDSTLP